MKQYLKYIKGYWWFFILGPFFMVLEALEKIQKFSFANMDYISTGSLITRITNDVSQIQNFIQTFLRGLFRSPVMMIGAVVMSFALEPKGNP